MLLNETENIAFDYKGPSFLTEAYNRKEFSTGTLSQSEPNYRRQRSALPRSEP